MVSRSVKAVSSYVNSIVSIVHANSKTYQMVDFGAKFSLLGGADWLLLLPEITL